MKLVLTIEDILPAKRSEAKRAGGTRTIYRSSFKRKAKKIAKSVAKLRGSSVMYAVSSSKQEDITSLFVKE